jgi:hypothetical protein
MNFTILPLSYWMAMGGESEKRRKYEKELMNSA